MSKLTLKMDFGSVGDGEALRYSRDLRRDLEGLDGIKVGDVEGAAQPGARGELSMIGAFALAVMSHEVVPILVQLLKGYLARDNRVTLEMTLPDGKTVRIDSSPQSAEQLKTLLAQFSS